MPARNIRILLIVVVVCLVCSRFASRTERTLRYVMTQVREQGLQPFEDRAHFEQAMFEGAVQGIMSQLDEHSSYVTSDELDGFKEMIDREFGGVGVEIHQDNETQELIVISPIFGSPAQQAGVRAGDIITEVDGVATAGMSLEDASSSMRGAPGEPVTLTIRRDETDAPLRIEVVRDLIHGDSVRGARRLENGSWKFLVEEDPRIAYLWVDSFTERTAEEIHCALAPIAEKGLDGLVLDLRGNPGGILTEAVDVCDMFLSSGDIVTTRYRDREIKERYAATAETAFPDVPIVVLVDGETASAGEIVAACLQDHRRAIVVGERSYGKGTVQELIELQPDLGMIKLTTASFWRPSGRNIHCLDHEQPNGQWGVSPDQGFVFDFDEETRDLLYELRYRRSVLPEGVDLPRDLEPLDDDPDTGEAIEDEELNRAIEHLRGDNGQRPLF